MIEGNPGQLSYKISGLTMLIFYIGPYLLDYSLTIYELKTRGAFEISNWKKSSTLYKISLILLVSPLGPFVKIIVKLLEFVQGVLELCLVFACCYKDAESKK